MSQVPHWLSLPDYPTPSQCKSGWCQGTHPGGCFKCQTSTTGNGNANGSPRPPHGYLIYGTWYRCSCSCHDPFFAVSEEEVKAVIHELSEWLRA